MGGRAHRGFLAAAVLLALTSVGGAQAAQGEPGGDMHYFEATVVVSGHAEVDYGEDRFTAKSNTSGVDGKASVKWTWEVRAAAFSEGGGGLVTRAIGARGRSSEKGSVISWGKGLKEVGETELCEDLGYYAKVTLTDDGRGIRHAKGDFVPDGSFGIRNGAVHAKGPYYLPGLCFHGSVVEHNFPYPEYVRGDQAPVPRGAFNPRSDRGFERDYPPTRVSHDRSQGSDPNSAHDYSAESRYSVEIDSISERRFDKLVRKYQHLPARDGEQVREIHTTPSPGL
jgi:hypothetical protein